MLFINKYTKKFCHYNRGAFFKSSHCISHSTLSGLVFFAHFTHRFHRWAIHIEARWASFSNLKCTLLTPDTLQSQNIITANTHSQALIFKNLQANISFRYLPINKISIKRLFNFKQLFSFVSSF